MLLQRTFPLVLPINNPQIDPTAVGPDKQNLGRINPNGHRNVVRNLPGVREVGEVRNYDLGEQTLPGRVLLGEVKLGTVQRDSEHVGHLVSVDRLVALKSQQNVAQYHSTRARCLQLLQSSIRQLTMF